MFTEKIYPRNFDFFRLFRLFIDPSFRFSWNHSADWWLRGHRRWPCTTDPVVHFAELGRSICEAFPIIREGGGGCDPRSPLQGVCDARVEIASLSLRGKFAPCRSPRRPSKMSSDCLTVVDVPEERFDEAVHHLKWNFFADEPLNNAVGLCTKGEPQRELERHCLLTLKQGYSRMLLDKKGAVRKHLPRETFVQLSPQHASFRKIGISRFARWNNFPKFEYRDNFHTIQPFQNIRSVQWPWKYFMIFYKYYIYNIMNLYNIEICKAGQYIKKYSLPEIIIIIIIFWYIVCIWYIVWFLYCNFLR